jgi:hypothetical protein
VCSSDLVDGNLSMDLGTNGATLEES